MDRETTALQNQGVNTGSRGRRNVCLNTQRVCLETARYCMSKGGDYVAEERVRLLLDTAALCHTVMDTVCRTSWLHTHATSACADLCSQLVGACERFPQDKRMMRCAKLCRQCLSYCNEATTITAA